LGAALAVALLLLAGLAHVDGIPSDAFNHAGISALFGHSFTVASISVNSFHVSIEKMAQTRRFLRIYGTR
jgi:hypothetical protein